MQTYLWSFSLKLTDMREEEYLMVAKILFAIGKCKVLQMQRAAEY